VCHAVVGKNSKLVRFGQKFQNLEEKLLDQVKLYCLKFLGRKNSIDRQK
jgi:hypothetical protein